MKITLSLYVPDYDDEDEETGGLTDEAHERLVAAIVDAGFDLAEGPRRVRE